MMDWVLSSKFHIVYLNVCVVCIIDVEYIETELLELLEVVYK